MLIGSVRRGSPPRVPARSTRMGRMPSSLRVGDILDAAVIAVADFVAEDPCELSFAKNDVLMLMTSTSDGLLPPDGWLYAKNHLREQGLVPANFVVSLSTSNPTSRAALADSGPELTQKITSTWMNELKIEVMKVARSAVTEHMQDQTNALLAFEQGERELQLMREIEQLKTEACERETRHQLEMERLMEQEHELALQAQEQLRVRMTRQLEDATDAGERLRARCLSVIGARRMIFDKLGVVKAELDRTNAECEKLRKDVFDVKSVGEQEEQTIAQIADVTDQLQRGATIPKLDPSVIKSHEPQDGDVDVETTLNQLTESTHKLQRMQSTLKVDAALVEANEALEAAHHAKQAAEEALADVMERLAHLEDAPPKINAGRIITFKNIKVNNVPDRDKQRGKDVSDPYVRILLLDDYGNAVEDECTKHLRNQSNPSWEQELTMPVAPHITFPPSFSVEVWDKDWKQEDERIGKVKITIDPSQTGRGRVLDCAVPVKGKKDAKAKAMLFGCWYELTPELFYGSTHEAERLAGSDSAARIIPMGRIISFTKIQAKNVPSMDAEGLSDPYARIALLDDDGKEVDDECTRFLRNQTNPVWHNTLSMPMPNRVSFPPVVRVELWDKDWNKEDHKIGGITVALKPHEMGRGEVRDIHMPVDGRVEDEIWEDERMTISFHYGLTPELYCEEALPDVAFRPPGLRD